MDMILWNSLAIWHENTLSLASGYPVTGWYPSSWASGYLILLQSRYRIATPCPPSDLLGLTLLKAKKDLHIDEVNGISPVEWIAVKHFDLSLTWEIGGSRFVGFWELVSCANRVYWISGAKFSLGPNECNCSYFKESRENFSFKIKFLAGRRELRQITTCCYTM